MVPGIGPENWLLCQPWGHSVPFTAWGRLVSRAPPVLDHHRGQGWNGCSTRQPDFQQYGVSRAVQFRLNCCQTSTPRTFSDGRCSGGQRSTP